MARIKLKISKVTIWLFVFGIVVGIVIGIHAAYVEQYYEPDYVKADPEFRSYVINRSMVISGVVFSPFLLIASITELIIRLRRWRKKSHAQKTQ